MIPKSYGGLSYGNATTSHASQGKTVDVPLVALGSESFPAANREQLYVSLSRGREAVRVYTDDKGAMMEAVQGSAARLSATELMEDDEPLEGLLDAGRRPPPPACAPGTLPASRTQRRAGIPRRFRSSLTYKGSRP